MRKALRGTNSHTKLDILYHNIVDDDFGKSLMMYIEVVAVAGHRGSKPVKASKLTVLVPLEVPLLGVGMSTVLLALESLLPFSSNSDLFLKWDWDHLGSATDSFIAFAACGSNMFNTSCITEATYFPQ